MTRPHQSPPSSPPAPALAYVVLLFAPVLMTSNMLAARWVQGSIPPVSLAFGRWLLTFLILLLGYGIGYWTLPT